MEMGWSVGDWNWVIEVLCLLVLVIMGSREETKERTTEIESSSNPLLCVFPMSVSSTVNEVSEGTKYTLLLYYHRKKNLSHNSY